ncbi:MAG: hypothetical protein ACTSQI_05115 [Candidatus Helarchaeota archaeon]
MSLNLVLYGLDVAARTLVIVFSFIFAVFFWRRRSELEMRSSRMVFLGQGMFVGCYGVTRLFFLFQLYFKEGYYVDIFPNAVMSDIIWKISTAIGILAIVFLLIVIETYLVKSRYIFSLVALVGCILSLILPVDDARIVTYIALPIAMIGVIALYAYLFFKSSGELRKKVSWSLNGFIIFGVGVVIDTEFGKNFLLNWIGIVPPFLAEVLMIVGLAIYTYYNIKD